MKTGRPRATICGRFEGPATAQPGTFQMNQETTTLAEKPLSETAVDPSQTGAQRPWKRGFWSLVVTQFQGGLQRERPEEPRRLHHSWDGDAESRS